MDTSTHNINTLFDQLGLPSSDRDIERFIETHRLFTGDIVLSEATFWTPAQAQFLKEALEDDSDWCEAVDELDSRLRC
ncbi:DUF2789 domain-containing protein [Marinobacterium arenosum]|uniref:DUF2789 domain-containing protein n=1 Tax=Marinobacterium arenosum TaxID=2862496 RepID=UPI001C9413E8|nr:DUF2789 domain-containing protein [Marinobacterium arenosum]MBY4679034.1 DUF2789 domain-containing protein [Marinobacterium arenosum]